MDQYPDLLRDPSGDTPPHTDWQTLESFSLDQEQRRGTSCLVTEEQNSDGSWSQRSISRSLQRAESLLRSTINPSLKWLFNVRSLDEEEEEGNLVVAHNLVSRSSARLLRLQHALLTVAPQWQPVGRAGTTSAQVCFKGLSGETGLLPSHSSPSLQEGYLALRRLQEQRCLLLFIHEFSRRAQLAAAFVCRVTQLLEGDRIKFNQTKFPWSSVRPFLVSLVQELRVHLGHWSSLCGRAGSDVDLRRVLVQHPQMVDHVRQSLDLLAVEVLVLVERYVVLVLRTVVQSEFGCVPVEVLEEVWGGTGLFNQTVWELRVQYSSTQRRTRVLQQAHIPGPGPGLPASRGYHPAGVGVKDLMILMAERHAHTAPQLLLNQSPQQVKPLHTGSDSCGTKTLNPDWTWNQLTDNITQQPSLLLLSPPPHTSSHTPSGLSSHLHQDQEDQPDSTRSAQVQLRSESSGSRSELLWGVQQDRWAVELLIRMLAPTGELLHPVTSETLEHVDQSAERRTETDQNQNQEDTAEARSFLNANTSPGVGADPEKGAEPAGSEQTSDRGQRWSPSIQWLDLGQSALFAQMLGQYHPLLVTMSRRALWLHLIAPPPPNCAASINLQDPPSRIRILNGVRRSAGSDHLPVEFRAMLEDFSLYLLASTAHAQWDHEVCRSLGSALKDRCLTGVNHPSSSEQDGSLMTSTMEHFLRLPPPLMSCLSSCQSNSRSPGPQRPPSSLCLHRDPVSLALATVQLSTVWVMSKSFQFLSSWSLNKFLLVTQGDLKVLSESLETMLYQIQTTMRSSESPSALHHHPHHQLLLKKQLTVLSTAVSQLQSLSSVVLRTFSRDCKKMSGELFEQMMPAAVHWRLNPRTGLPSSPSEYASAAAQSVIGQVLEGVAPLSEDARVQALSITMTAFMEAWMEHILSHRIKFSVQGALQLKQDFDSIREMIQSEQYGLSADLHHRLLSLRVFQQVDSAVVCLLQQPQAKPYLQSRAWEPFTHCCPSHGSRGSIDSVVGSSITNLRCMEGEELTDPSMVTSDLPPADPSSPGEPYLAPSAALGPAQQDWLDLRIHSSSARRWRLPGLHCLSKTEP